MARITFFYGLILSAVLQLFAVQAISAPNEITREEAKNVVKIWLTGQGYDTHSLRFVLDKDPDQTSFPDFFFFSAAYEQEQSVPTLGHFAVGRKSADLWDWELCKRLQAPAVRSIQESLRKRIGLSRRDYRELSKIAPCSEPT
jgi:hypothetical protein